MRRSVLQGLLRGGGVEERLHLIDLFALERANVVRQQPRQFREHVTDAEDARQRRQVLDRSRRADLHAKPPARFFVGADRGDGLIHALDRALVQRADQLFHPDAIVGEQSAIDVLAQRPGFGGHQIAADPLPDRLQRDARQASDALVIGGTVDQERLQRQ